MSKGKHKVAIRRADNPERHVTPGYHLTYIEKGSLGDFSKLAEELAELRDAEQQGVRIMALVELSDLVGAVEAYLDKNFPGFTLDDLIAMKDVTQRAFRNGHRG